MSGYICCQYYIERKSSLYSADRWRTWLRNNSYFPYAVWFISLDEDECLKTPPACDVNANCKNTLGSYLCSCKEGFTGDGNTCQGKWSEKHWLHENISDKYDVFIAFIWSGLLSSQERSGITLLYSAVLSSTIWPQLRLVGLRLSQADHFIKTGGHFVVSKEITINNRAILCRCRSLNPSLCRLSLFCCSLSLFQGHFASVSKFSLTGPQESGQNKCNQRRPT